MKIVWLQIWLPLCTLIWYPAFERPAHADDHSATVTYVAKDTLSIGEEDSADAKECLENLSWKATTFDVTLRTSRDPYLPAIIRFVSPHSSGNETNDLVAMEWFQAKNEDDQIVSAPAVVVIHESGEGMEVGRLIARALYAQGLHAFLMHLPTYGLRRPEHFVPQMELVGTVMKQGIADARRARDAVAVLPHVDARSISIQGTSLGGFVTATAAGLDRGFSTVHIMVAGGNLYHVIANGVREAGQMREMLAKGGYTGEKLRQLVAPIEPLRVAHRYDRRNTWIYTASRDQVIPPARATELRLAAGLDQRQEFIMYADHYSGIVYLPVIAKEIARKIRNELESRNSKE